MIYVTVGTMYLDFPRLIRKMDEIAKTGGAEVVIQTGMGKTIPEHCDHFDFKPREEILALQEKASLIVCHAGIGSIIDALNARKPLAVVPRLRKFGEHNNDHQCDLARAVEGRNWGRAVFEIDDLDEICATPPAAYTSYTPAREQLITAVRTAIERALAL